MSDNRNPNPFLGPRGGIVKEKVLPESCIESCETILRTHNAPAYKFTGFGQRSTTDAPPMMLTLKNRLNSTDRRLSKEKHETLNVSDTESEDTLKWCEGKQSLLEDDFKLSCLQRGEGVAFVNSGRKDERYNMHFLAVIEVKSADNVVLSDISEPEGKKQRMIPINNRTVKANSIGDLRDILGEPYNDKTKKFIAGKVWLDKGAAKQESAPETE